MWLELWLNRRQGTTLVISHDRDFLDRIATDIVHLAGGRARSYRGNYSSFERQLSENLALQQAMYAKQQKRVKEIQAFVDRFRAQATKAQQAQSRLKQLERMTLIAPAHADSPYRFSFPNPDRVSNPLLHIEDAALGYGDAVVLTDLRLTLQAGARVGLLGKNGASKSTLIRGIAGELPLIEGRYERGKHAGVGYFTQHTMESLSASASPMAHLAAAEVKATEQAMRNYLGGWGFSGDMALDPVETLSGGEKARLALALIAWRKPALLLLDEPTNHLDLDMRHALTIALQSYEGALVIVSHDRHLIENTVDELLLVAEHRVEPYEGTLDEYRDWLLGRDTASRSAKRTERDASASRRQDGARKREQMKPLKNTLRDLEKQISKLEPKLKAINDQLADTETYQQLDSEAVTALVTRHKRYQERLELLEHEWVSVSEQIETANA